MNRWKSIFYKGTPVNENCSATLAWDRILDQCPGLWFGDVQNNLRVAVVTSIDLPTNCIAQSGKRNRDGSQHVVGDDRNDKLLNCANKAVRTESRQAVKILEYAEAENIPIGEWFMFTTVMTSRRVELYINGKLWVTKVFIGSPVYNNQNGYFGTGATYSGSLTNFRYLPHSLPSFMVEHLYNMEASQSFRKRSADDVEY